MKEIGGYIELDEYGGHEYHESAIAVNSGRHALEYLIKINNIKKIYLPFFLCDSIRNLCKKCGCNYELYHTASSFTPIFDKHLDNNEYLYIVNYYGQLKNEDIIKYKSTFGNIIVDNAQDFFSEPIKGIDTVYTCRKFFGVCDGGYVYANSNNKIKLQQDISYMRMRYILGRYEEGANKFYDESSENNKCFANTDLKAMSKLTHNLLRRIDYDDVIKKRNKNFIFLHNALESKNKLNLTIPSGPFMYPFYSENGPIIKKELIKNRIYVPTLWNDTLKLQNHSSIEENYVNNIIPLPIDQRYNSDDMKYIIKIMKGLV